MHLQVPIPGHGPHARAVPGAVEQVLDIYIENALRVAPRRSDIVISVANEPSICSRNEKRCIRMPTPALAETSASQRASAEALFQQATKLMDEKRYGEACEKLAGSQDLDPALGTMLYLADCYEHAGRSASAGALFHESMRRGKFQGMIWAATPSGRGCRFGYAYSSLSAQPA